MKLSGADIVVRCLQEEGVVHVFGYPGGALLHIYDALFKQDRVKHILVRHEQGAIHAADAYSRSSTRVGVGLVTSGPGLTNAITGIATAYMDSVPLVIISGQVPTYAIGQDAFQECDAIGITRPCVKHNFLVRRVEDIASTIKKAFYLAKTGRPGPVLVDIPKDITAPNALADFDYTQSVVVRSYNPSPKVHLGQIRRAVQLIQEAKRPLVYAGGGVILSDTSSLLVELVRYLKVPCTTTLMGLGGYPATDPQFLGMLGMHGTCEANMAMQNCDVLLAIGARFDDRVIGNVDHFMKSGRKIVHVDIDPSSISKRVKADVPIVGDLREVLVELFSSLRSEISSESLNHAPWWAEIEEWRKSDSLRYDRNNHKVIKPQRVIELLSTLTKNKEVIITSDVGQHQMFVAQFFKFEKPRCWINSGGLGTMGVGLPYAMGAKLANPDKEVICVTGEGSIQMCLQELSTCKQYRVPVKIINLNNRYLGMVRQWQEFFHGNRHSESYMDALPDFVKLAEAYGHVGLRVESVNELQLTLEKALSITDSCVFVDVLIDQTENVFPMIPNGKGLSEMVMSEHLD